LVLFHLTIAGRGLLSAGLYRTSDAEKLVLWLLERPVVFTWRGKP
jgi:hypothetical protein